MMRLFHDFAAAPSADVVVLILVIAGLAASEAVSLVARDVDGPRLARANALAIPVVLLFALMIVRRLVEL